MRNLAIYIHYPFCKSKCPYCDFNSHVRESVNDDIWLNAYLSELDKYSLLAQAPLGFSPSLGLPSPSARNPSDTDKTIITSIFFGGGTPSLMPAKTVEAIISRIAKNWQLADDVEITLEANPTSVEYNKFKDFKAAGVNRVSIGVQSFVEEELKFLGREHNAHEATQAINYAAKIFDNYSFDLIYALPTQSLKSWENQLHDALKMAKYHISVYQLTIEPNTNFYHRKVQVPKDDIAAEFYRLTQAITNAAGLPAYEISNHARKGYESKHNLIYWRYGDYLGIGPGAHGRINGNATIMTKSPEKWLEAPLESSIKLTEHEKFEEQVLMGIRLNEGLPINLKPQLKNLDMLIAENYLQETQSRITATPKGFLMLNSVISKLLEV